MPTSRASVRSDPAKLTPAILALFKSIEAREVSERSAPARSAPGIIERPLMFTVRE